MNVKFRFESRRNVAKPLVNKNSYLWCKASAAYQPLHISRVYGIIYVSSQCDILCITLFLNGVVLLNDIRIMGKRLVGEMFAVQLHCNKIT